MYIYDTETNELLAAVHPAGCGTLEITGDGTLQGIMMHVNHASFFFKTTKITVE